MAESYVFFAKLDALLTTSAIVIDRPRGSIHPRYDDIIYPLDYGYLDGTSSGDGDGIDVWLGTMTGEKRIVAALVTVDTVKRDVEVKVLVNCTEEEIATIVQFHESNETGCYLIQRNQ
jgi:inorganic pyrophosphatase